MGPGGTLPSRAARGGTLILGGGFAGSSVARLLGRRGATIVSPENFMLCTPILPEAASGALEPRHAVVPLRAMCPHPKLLHGSVVQVDVRHRVRVDATLAVVGHPGFWALGDCARVPKEATPDHPDPPNCQYALRQARRLAKHLVGPPRPDRYRMLGQVATLGRYKGGGRGLRLRPARLRWVVRLPHPPPLPASPALPETARRHRLEASQGSNP